MIETYFAKTDGTTLIAHSKDVKEAGINLLSVLTIDNDYWTPKIIRAALLHDLGKIHPDFQLKLIPDSKNNVFIRHELISALYTLRLIPLDEVFAIATHHKGVERGGEEKKRLSLNMIKISQQQYEDIQELIKSISSEWINYFGLEFRSYSTDLREFQQLLNSKFQLRLPDEQRLELALMRALLIAADHIASGGNINYPKPMLIDTSLFQPKNGEERVIEFRSFQQKMLSIQGDALLHAPTGSGKTEAAMCWVTKNQSLNSKLFYLLPYTASANAMEKRLSDIYGEDKVTVLHSKSLDFFFDEISNQYDDNTDSLEIKHKIQDEAKNKKQLSKEIFYPVKVATPHQILKNATLSRGWEMCLLEYRDAIFILDEFHTYDALLTGLIFATVKWLQREFNAKILFMSATIPKFMEEYILKYILDGNTSKILRPDKKEESDALILGRKRHILSFREDVNISDCVQEVEYLLEKKNKVLVIVNNVSTAQNLFSKINFEGKKALLHSGFNRRDRVDIEKKITSKTDSLIPQLLIATQAVEVSLDIDYDCAFIENAPIDALIQRFGRVNRAGKKALADIVLIRNSEGKTPFYDESVCEKTWNELRKFEGIPLAEDDLINACNIVYKDGYNEIQQKDFEQGLNNDTINNFKSQLIAGDWSDAFERIFENDKQKIEILCYNLKEEYTSLIEQKRYIEANQLLVSVYGYQLGRRLNKDERLDVIVSTDFIYDCMLGCRKEKLEDRFW